MGIRFQEARFPTTHWSLVARAGCNSAEAQRQALGELLTQYMPALRAHLLYGKHLSAEDADDLLQDFVAAKIVEKQLLGRADAELGKFRTFLLAALDHFWIDRLRERAARKRSPGAGGVQALGERVEQLAGAHASDAFEQAWARQVLNGTLRLMRAECAETDRDDVWGVFECRLLAPLLHSAEPIEYDQLVARFGLQSPSQASNVLITAKRMFVRLMRSVVGQYAQSAAEIESEINDLMTILARG